MPGTITHLNVAYVFYKNKGIVSDFPMFLLGSICPDSVNINGHAPKNVRWPVHLRDADLLQWEQNAKNFYNENKGKYNESYLLGYILHIVTDIVWDREYDMPLCTLLYKSGVPKEELKNKRWLEIDGYEYSQKDKGWLKFSLSELKKAEPLDIGYVKKDEVEKWKQLALDKNWDKIAVAKFIDDKFMGAFFDSVSDNLLKIIES